MQKNWISDTFDIEITSAYEIIGKIIQGLPFSQDKSHTHPLGQSGLS